MSVSDERTLERISEPHLRRGDRIVEIYSGEMGTGRRLTVTRMVESVEGWYVVTEAYRAASVPCTHGDRWRENPTGSVVEVDEAHATTKWLGS